MKKNVGSREDEGGWKGYAHATESLRENVNARAAIRRAVVRRISCVRVSVALEELATRFAQPYCEWGRRVVCKPVCVCVCVVVGSGGGGGRRMMSACECQQCSD